jgi:hypothetical protein
MARAQAEAVGAMSLQQTQIILIIRFITMLATLNISVCLFWELALTCAVFYLQLTADALTNNA